jgi:type II pantothenate kinase
MIIGFDKGASSAKLVMFEGNKPVFTRSFAGNEMTACEQLLDSLRAADIALSDITEIAATGIGAEKSRFEELGKKPSYVREIEATGEGGLWLSGCDGAIVVSIGTGTSIVLSEKGTHTHIGGSGVGSGMLCGLAKKLFGLNYLPDLFKLAEKGNRLAVDITVGDLFSGTETLPIDLTAANLAKCPNAANDSDWAIAIINTVLEVAGSHAALACNAYGIKNVIITGGISQTGIAKTVYENFAKLYGLNYLIPEFSGFATAIGAVRKIINGSL